MGKKKMCQGHLKHSCLIHPLMQEQMRQDMYDLHFYIPIPKIQSTGSRMFLLSLYQYKAGRLPVVYARAHSI